MARQHGKKQEARPLSLQARIHIPGALLTGQVALEKETTTLSSTLAWEIPRTEETGRLRPMGSQKVGHD